MDHYLSGSAKPALRLLCLLATGMMVGCGGGGGGGGGDTQLGGEQAVEASVGVAVSTLRSLPQFFLVPALELEPLTNGSLRTRQRITNGATGGPSEFTCAGGGSKEIRCVVDERGETSLDISYRGCREDTGNTNTRNGSLSIEALDPDLCRTGILRDDLPFSFELSRFSSVVTDDGGAEIARFTASLRESVVPEPGGCFTLDGTRTVAGTFDIEVPNSGLDLSLTARELALEISSTGSPCEQRIAVDGGLEVDDRARGERYSQTFDEALFAVSQPGGLTLLSVSGEVSNSCIGVVDFISEAPLRIEPLGECPTGGTLTLEFADGNAGAIRFTSGGGVEIDFGNDGVAERSVTSCLDASLSRCER